LNTCYYFQEEIDVDPAGEGTPNISAFLTKTSLMKKSPYTQFFATALKEMEEEIVLEDNSNAPRNDLYSPSGFKCLKDVMHLFPLWSRPMYYLALSKTSSEKSPSSMTNAKVESYFRTLKKGTLMGRTKLRPREILCEELRRVRGAIKATMLPESFRTALKRKTHTSFLNEEEEKWREKKRRKKYSDPKVTRRVLNPTFSETESAEVRCTGKAVDDIEGNDFQPLKSSAGTEIH